jgi:hypothetical protein
VKHKHSRVRTLTLAFAALTLALVACAPAATSGGQPLIAVLNGPANGRIAGSAALLESEMRAQGPLPFAFVNDAAMRFAEGHNDLFHDRAVTAAGRIARSYGAAYAVLIGAPTLTRDVTVSKDGSARWVDITLRMEAEVVDASTNQVVAHFESPLLERTRHESTADALPSLQNDPDVLVLRDQGVRDVAPAVVGAVLHALHAPASAG